MADARLRQLERAALGTQASVPDLLAYAAALLRQGETSPEVRNRLHALVRHNKSVRPLFFAMLPELVHAFCGGCGAQLELSAEGYPTSKTGRKSPNKKNCDTCIAKSSTVRGLRVKQHYCGRCGVVMRSQSHRCVTQLPGWCAGADASLADAIQGAQRVTGTRKPHWSNWRAL